MPADDILLDAEDHMEKALDHLKHELRGVRTGRANPALGEFVKVDYYRSPTHPKAIPSHNRPGRANPAMVEFVKVDYYGSPTDLKAIASINVPEPTQLLIKPFSPGDMKAIERAINDAKLPMTPHSDGKTLRLTLPSMSQEVRLRMAGQ